MAEPQDRPLWEVMTCASGQLLDKTFGDATFLQCFAAEIRALTDVVVPEEADPGRDLGTLLPRERWAERQRIRALLLAEAERAEKGE
jgi:hypothetical protein